MLQTIPAELKFAFEPGATIYLPGRVTPTIIRGSGHLTLSFERTEKAGVLAVAVRDLHWRLHPFAIPLDVDHDGQLESIELTGIELGPQVLDLKRSTGTLDLRSGEMELVFSYVVSPDDLPVLEQLGGRTIQFTVTDRGRMNLATGCFEIHSAVMQIKQWPLRGALVRGGGCGCVSDGPPSSVVMSVSIQTPGASGCGDVAQKEVTICPGDQVILCWRSSEDVQSVELDPGGVALPASGVYVVAPAGPGDVVYRLTATGARNAASDSVEVHVYQGGWLGPYQALPNGFGWTLELPPTSVSGRLEVQAVQLAPRDCLRWEKFLLEHTPAGAAYPDFGRPIEGTAEVELGAKTFRAAGTWLFTAQLDPPNQTPYPRPQESLPVCFRFRGVCSRL